MLNNYLNYCAERKKKLVPWGIWWRKGIAWKKENHFPDSLFTVFADWTCLMQHNITVVCVNDNNPPGLSISTRSLWPARQGERRALVNRGLWVLQFTVAKIALPLVGHVTTGTAAGPGSVLAGVWWNRTLTQMTGPDAFHLDGESKALVRDKCAVRGHKSTSLQPKGGHTWQERKGNLLFKTSSQEEDTWLTAA